MLADEPENDTAGLVESFSTDAAGSLASMRDFSPSLYHDNQNIVFESCCVSLPDLYSNVSESSSNYKEGICSSRNDGQSGHCG